MYKLSLAFVFLINFCYANQKEPKVCDKLSKVLSDELGFIGMKLSEALNEENVKINSSEKAHDWQLVAVENNVTVDQLKTIFQLSSKLRIYNFPSETDTAKANITLVYFREACEQYVPAKAKITTLPTTTASGFWENIVQAFMKPLAFSITFVLQVSMFVNATTTAEKLRIFEGMCDLIVE